MNIIKENNLIKVYNDGIKILTGESIEEIKELVNILMKNTDNKWELEILSRILYNVTTSNYCSTTEVA